MTFAEELEIILNQELLVMKKLTELAFQKTNAIMEDDLDQIREIVKGEENLVNNILSLEDRRMKTMDSWGVDPNSSISNLIEKVPEGGEGLLHIKNELASVMIKLDERNKANEKLVMQNLEWIDFNMNLLTSSQTPAAYGQDTEEKTSGDSNIFDRKV